MKINPGTAVTAVCTFTLKGGPCKYQGKVVWAGVNPKDGTPSKDVITQVDDPDNGISTATIDGSANGLGDQSQFTCSADVDLATGTSILVGTSDVVDWTPKVDIEADGVSMELSQPSTATVAQAAVHRENKKPLDPNR